MFLLKLILNIFHLTLTKKIEIKLITDNEEADKRNGMN